MTRSRNGCATCKKRHRKCDETRPTCLACRAQNIDCEGYDLTLRWGFGIASRGRFAGASDPSKQSALDKPQLGSRSRLQRRLDSTSKRQRERRPDKLSTKADLRSDDSSPAAGADVGRIGSAPPGWDQSSWESLWSLPASVVSQNNSGDADSELESWTGNAMPPRASTSGDNSPTVVSLFTSQPSWPSVTNQDRVLFQEFCETTVFLLSGTHVDDVLGPNLRRMAHKSEALYNMLLATQLYATSPAAPPPAFDDYYTRGISIFRGQLESFNGVPDEVLLTTGLYVCTLNLLRGVPWFNQVECMANLYGLNTDLTFLGNLHNTEARHPVEMMAVMALPTFVRGRKQSGRKLELWKRLREAQELKWPGGRLSGVETMSGIPRTLLDIFAVIEDGSAENAFLAWPGEVGEVPQCHLWEAYRIAGILLSRRIHRHRVDVSAETASSFKPESSPITSYTWPGATTEVLVGRLVASLDALCDSSRRSEFSHLLATNSMLYPYTAARLEIDVLKKHPSWVSILHRSVKLSRPYGKTGNVQILEDMLNEALKSGDDDYDIDEHARCRSVQLSMF